MNAAMLRLLLMDEFDEQFTFYLGVDRPRWLGDEGLTGIPLFVSHSRLRNRRKFPRAVTRWSLDSAGFTDIGKFGEYQSTPQQYAEAAQRYANEIGMLDFAMPQDLLCDPDTRAITGLTVAEHQARAVRSYLELSNLAPDVPFIPVLQGWESDDYMRHAEAYYAAGVRLDEERRVAIGTLALRQQTREARDIIHRMADQGFRLHALGFKMKGLRKSSRWIASADSASWNIQGWRDGKLPECTHPKKNCAGCMRYALRWRERLLEYIAVPQQGSLVF
jgi:hypothetical protein